MGEVAWWVKFLPRFLQPKYFVVSYYPTLPPSVLPMELWGVVASMFPNGVVAKNVTYREATAIAVLLPMGDRYDG